MLAEAREIRNEEVLSLINIAICANSSAKPETLTEVRDMYLTKRMRKDIEKVAEKEDEIQRKIIFQKLKLLQR